MHQKDYLRQLEHLAITASFSEFRSMRMKLAWLGNTREDLAVDISQLAQVTEAHFNDAKRATIKRLNRVVVHAILHPLSLKFPSLDPQSVRVIGFADASFANNADSTSQLWHITFLEDKHGNAAPIHFRSYKARRVTRSVLSAEVIAFSDVFDVGIALTAQLSAILRRRVPLILLTDSKSLFDVISKGSRTSESRTLLDIAAAREGYRRREISNIGFVRSDQNLADGLTKTMTQAALPSVLSTGKLQITPEQWIIRDSGEKSLYSRSLLSPRARCATM